MRFEVKQPCVILDGLELVECIIAAEVNGNPSHIVKLQAGKGPSKVRAPSLDLIFADTDEDRAKAKAAQVAECQSVVNRYGARVDRARDLLALAVKGEAVTGEDPRD